MRRDLYLSLSLYLIVMKGFLVPLIESREEEDTKRIFRLQNGFDDLGFGVI